MNCKECEYYKYCEELNYLNLADECGNTLKFVSEIRSDAIDEFENLLYQFGNYDSFSTKLTIYKEDLKRLSKQLKDKNK